MKLGYFVWKITILRQKIIFFFNFRALNCRPGIWGRTLQIWDEDNFTIHLYENVLKNIILKRTVYFWSCLLHSLSLYSEITVYNLHNIIVGPSSTYPICFWNYLTLNCRPGIWGRTLQIWDEDNFTIHLYENVLRNTYNFGLF
jgi:hypothetical protein